MKRIITLHICLIIASIISIFAQKAILVYHGDEISTFFFNEIDSICYGSSENGIVMQEFWSSNTVYKFEAATIDSICFSSTKYIEQENVVNIANILTDYIIRAEFDGENSNLYLNATVPSRLLPTKNEYIYQLDGSEKLPLGFAGKVLEINNLGSEIELQCINADYADVFKQLVWFREINTTNEEEESNNSFPQAVVQNDGPTYAINLPYLGTELTYPDLISGSYYMTDEMEDIPLGKEEPKIVGHISVKPKIRCSSAVIVQPVNGIVYTKRRLFSNVEAKIKATISGKEISKNNETVIVRSHEPIKMSFPLGFGENIQLSYSGSMTLAGGVGIDYSFEGERSSTVLTSITYDKYGVVSKDIQMLEGKNSMTKREIDVALDNFINLNASLSLSINSGDDEVKSLSASYSYGESITGPSIYRKSQLSPILDTAILYNSLMNNGVTVSSSHVASGNINYLGLQLSDKLVSSDNNLEKYYIVPKLSNVDYNKSTKIITFDVEGKPMKSSNSKLGICFYNGSEYTAYDSELVWPENCSTKFSYVIPDSYNKNDRIIPTVTLPNPSNHKILAMPYYDYEVTDEDVIGLWTNPWGGRDYFTTARFKSNHIGALYFVGDEPHEFTWKLSGHSMVLDFFYEGLVYEHMGGTIELDGDYVTYRYTSISYEDNSTYSGTITLKRRNEN